MYLRLNIALGAPQPFLAKLREQVKWFSLRVAAK
jgi:hypothetical protein